MKDINSGEVSINSESDIINSRKVARSVAVRVGFGITDVTRVVTAVSELARNIYVFAGSGVMRWSTHPSADSICLELTFEDKGPGIADISQIMMPGYSTGGGLGMGLPGCKRLMDEMEISSEVDKGTTVIIKKWMRKK